MSKASSSIRKAGNAANDMAMWLPGILLSSTVDTFWKLDFRTWEDYQKFIFKYPGQSPKWN